MFGPIAAFGWIVEYRWEQLYNIISSKDEREKKRLSQKWERAAHGARHGVRGTEYGVRGVGPV